MSGTSSIGILVLLAFVLVGWIVGQYYYSTQIRHDSTRPVATGPIIIASDCDASRQQCFLRIESLELSLKLGPPVDALKPFDVKVVIAVGEGRDPDSVEIEFMMTEMDMGIHRYRLAASESGVWRGRAVLPVCITGRRDWYAIVTVIAARERLQVQFPFSVGQ